MNQNEVSDNNSIDNKNKFYYFSIFDCVVFASHIVGALYLP